MRRILATATTAATLFCAAAPLLLQWAAAQATVNPDTVTISGISAGAAFAVQYELAYSSQVRAGGIVAGLPYLCAGGNLGGAEECMSVPETIDEGLLMYEAQYLASEKKIDPLSNVASHAVMLFSGVFDTVVAHGSMLKVADQYKQLGVGAGGSAGPLKTYFNYTAEHAWITDFFGNACYDLGTPYVNNCGLDFAGEFLRMAFTHMKLTFNETKNDAAGRLYTFDQTYFGEMALISMDTVGYAYIPDVCTKNGTTCHVHVNFHGCEQDRTTLGSTYVSNTGLNRRAEANGIIILYPQTIPSYLYPSNPNGCFDWWGYTGNTYTQREGAQMALVNNMVQYVIKTASLPGLTIVS